MARLLDPLPMADSPTITPTVVIAGTGSGVGKTSLSLAICAALARRGLRVQPFKVGPDFLDPTYLTLAAGRTCHNLDGWMCGASFVRALVADKGADADVVLIEGVMGMYDGAAADSPVGSTAEIATWLDAPVVLVVNAHGAARSVAAVVKGFATLDATPGVAAVIANHCGSETHVAWLGKALAAAALPGLVGAVPRGALPELQSRHLGLVTADALGVLPEATLTDLAAAAEEHLDLDKLLALAARVCGTSVPAPEAPRRAPVDAAEPTKAPVRIGVARDRAFHFYYAANLEALQAADAELVEFSPLADAALPAGLDGLYIGGGYPEEYAAELTGNTAMRTAIAQFAAAGGAVYAECGGLMYLAEAGISREGKAFPMCGVLPVATRMLGKLRRLGYAEVTTTGPSVWGATGVVVRGHEFHYSEVVPETEARLAAAGWEHVYLVRYGRGGEAVVEGFAKNRVLASYIHLHFAAQPQLAAAFVQFCRDSGRPSPTEHLPTPLKSGFTTGTCAAAATQAAARVLAGEPAPGSVLVALPEAGAAPLRVPVEWARVLAAGCAAEAAVRKDAGSDPDVTHGSLVVVRVDADHPGAPAAAEAPDRVRFAAGDGVGIVTKAGLQIPPGEPAINPVPRRMMERSLRTVMPTGAWRLTVSVLGGRELAAKTFNPRLGIVGGISILGTTGRVRPFSHQALQEALRCALDVAAAAGCVPVVLVPGNIGRRAVLARFAALREEQVIEVGNEWGFMLDACRCRPVFTQWLLAGHPGKLAKFLEQGWDTHSARSGSALVPLRALAVELGVGTGLVADATTAEGLFAALPEAERRRLGDTLAARLRDAVRTAYQPAAALGVWLCDMKGQELGYVPPA